MITVSHETLRKQLSEIYRAWGMDEDEIGIVVNNMVESDLRGIDSHGAGMLPTYAERRRGGAVNVKPNNQVVSRFRRRRADRCGSRSWPCAGHPGDGNGLR